MKTDPVDLEILMNKFVAATEQMGFALRRTARTLYVKESCDFGTGITTPEGRFFAYPWSIGVCGFVGGECGPAISAVDEADPLEPGDVIITNHPYDSQGLASHLPDLHVLQPYFRDGRIVAFGWCFVHSSDVGGKVPGSISPSNYELYQEGFAIPPMKLMRRGEFNRDFLTLYKANVRMPEPNIGDIKAMLSALSVGEQRVGEAIEQYGVETILQAQTDLLAYAARRARDVLRKIPDGTYHFWDYIDDDYVTPFPTRIRVAMTVDDGKVHLDFAGTDPQTLSAFNLPNTPHRHTWFPARLIAFMCTYDEIGTMPLNAGLFENIRVSTPKGSIVNPEFPAAVGIRHTVGRRILDVVNGALVSAVPELMAACSGGLSVPIVLAEHDPVTGMRKVQVIETLTVGQGARKGCDGVDGRDSAVSNMMNIPMESVEAAGGVIFRRYGLRPDSGGPGKWRGGTGMTLTFEVLGDGGIITARGTERLRFGPWGLAGGRPGVPGRVVANMGTNNEKDLGKIDTLHVQAGDTLTVMTPGSGGYGDPFERDPQMHVQAGDTLTVMTPGSGGYGDPFERDPDGAGRRASRIGQRRGGQVRLRRGCGRRSRGRARHRPLSDRWVRPRRQRALRLRSGARGMGTGVRRPHHAGLLGAAPRTAADGPIRPPAAHPGTGPADPTGTLDVVARGDRRSRGNPQAVAGGAGRADRPWSCKRPPRRIGQIVVGRNRLRRSADHVNLAYLIEIERIHAPDRNRIAVPINRDPL